MARKWPQTLRALLGGKAFSSGSYGAKTEGGFEQWAYEERLARYQGHLGEDIAPGSILPPVCDQAARTLCALSLWGEFLALSSFRSVQTHAG